MTNHISLFSWGNNHTTPILLLGLDGAGKTTLLEQLKWLRLGTGLPLSTVMATVGLNVARIPSDEGALLVWDLSGHATLRPLWKNYTKPAAAFIFVIDCSDTVRAAEAVEVLREVCASEDSKGKPLLVLLNKSDVTNELQDWGSLLLPVEEASEPHLASFRVVTLSATTTPQLLDRAVAWLTGQVHKF